MSKKNVASSLALFLLVKFSCLVVLHAAQMNFVEVPRFQNHFIGSGSNSKCLKPVYNTLFKPIVSDDTPSAIAKKRIHGYVFSQVVLVGRVDSVIKDKSDPNGNEFYILVTVECYLRGDMGQTKIEVRKLGGSNIDDRCFPLPIEELQSHDRVLVYGNVAADQRGILPLEGGVQKLSSIEKANQKSYLPLLCIDPKIVIPSENAGQTEFCKKTPEIVSQCNSDVLSMSDVSEEMIDNLNLLKVSLKESSNKIFLPSLQLKPYVYSEYEARISPVASQTSSERKCQGLVCASCHVRYSTCMLLFFVCLTALLIDKLI